ncbi:hypothetical protein ABZ816_20750 [Actinosynnema sp. NPDC047251]|uniref:DUF4352 domain-containing protein n=1 Tax=Saccharothrix espanaensis (strain ATCC 51144 / DSM 44229 / JCM 9112 / NBRC 15066 / NRRL 15764) TaxID=1179773 RepID=K0KEP1_SACES|nr:hypothetical protein [Saccharothrix espanaensis]CCH34993.1 hypothetical protein BN6_77730 [Saccharothrix espanaensis DSM 44229]
MTYPQSAQAYPPAAPQPKPTKFGALAWTALILGIVGVVGSPIIILNNLTIVVAFVGAVLGVIALFGTKKVLAGIGTALCVLAIVFTVIAQKAAVEKIDEIINGTTNQGQVSNGDAGKGQVGNGDEGKGQATQADAAKTPPTWGQRYTWKSGLAVEVSVPAACTPGQYASPQGVERAVKITVTVTNGTDKAFETALLTMGSDAQFNSKKAEQIFDSNGQCGGGGLDSATVLPGKTYTYETSYSVGTQPGELQVTFQPDFGSDKAIFVGQA